MNIPHSRTAGLVASAALTVLFVGCVGVGPRYRSYSPEQSQVTVAYQDDYDYYPGYEVYYSRNRHEYVYRDGNAWVRRTTAPRGLSLNVLLAAPSVRLDFHDSPEQHHNSVVKTYPKTWKQPATVRADRHDDRPDKKNGQPDGKKKERGDNAKDDHQQN